MEPLNTDPATDDYTRVRKNAIERVRTSLPKLRITRTHRACSPIRPMIPPSTLDDLHSAAAGVPAQTLLDTLWQVAQDDAYFAFAMLKALRSEGSPQRTASHTINALPDDMLACIFFFCSFEERSRLRRVSRRWQRVIQRNTQQLRVIPSRGVYSAEAAVRFVKQHPRVTELTVSGPRDLSSQHVRSMCRRLVCLRSLRFKYNMQLDMTLFAKVAPVCSGLQRLRLDHSQSSSGPPPETDEAMLVLSKHCLLLQRVHLLGRRMSDRGVEMLSRCSQLTHVCIEHIRHISDIGLEHLVFNLKGLISLKLSGGLTALHLSDTSLVHIANHCSMLRELQLVKLCTEIDGFSIDGLSLICERLCGTLEVLDLDMPGSAPVLAELNKLTLLRSLNLSYMHYRNLNADLRRLRLLSALHNVTRLQARDVTIECCAVVFPNVQHVEMEILNDTEPCLSMLQTCEVQTTRSLSRLSVSMVQFASA
eukprot:TRINITY_DN9392_c0_g1_i1.p1 TRINITY_DN9392_c0_g1~~TRINITY_DN9392_c0_g1_i1.p1  ORF type:complete len:499 (-),score=62.52 TRINITY_DN9392_c0_g1_i1:537-1967(-)